MFRLVVVSNRVAPIQEGEAISGGLAAGMLDALRGKGGIWFGWSGQVAETAEPTAKRPITIDLLRRDYDAFYRGFANDQQEEPT